MGVAAAAGAAAGAGAGVGRSDMDYPSLNFVRPSLVNLEDAPQEVSIDEGHRLTIRKGTTTTTKTKLGICNRKIATSSARPDTPLASSVNCVSDLFET